MKQKVSRVHFTKTENFSVWNTSVQGGDVFCPKAFSENVLKKRKKLTGRSHPSGLKTKTERWRPRAAVVTGGDPRRGRGIGRYQRVHRVLPHLWVVKLSVSEHHVNGELCSGGRRLGWSRGSLERAAKVELRLGLGYWVH